MLWDWEIPSPIHSIIKDFLGIKNLGAHWMWQRWPVFLALVVVGGGWW